jgi:hypothetical protein
MNEYQREPQDHFEHPKGGLAITLIYLVLVVGAWCLVYVTVLGRGATL